MEAFLVEGASAESEWRELLQSVASSGALRVQHSLEWRDAVRRAYPSLEPAYVIARNGREGFGLPSFYLKSRLFGNRLVSLPFSDYGGFVGRPSPQATAIVFEKLRTRFNCKNIEARLAGDSPSFSESRAALEKNSFSPDNSRELAVIGLAGGEKALWEGFDRSVRKNVNTAERSGLEVREFVSVGREMDAFHEMYFSSMKSFGSPHHSKKFFESLSGKLVGKFFGFNSYKDGELLGAIIMLVGQGYATIPFHVSAPSRQARLLRPSNLLHWKAIKKAVGLGATRLDMGRVQASPEEGSHAAGIREFKLKWKPQLFPLPFYSLPSGAAGKSRPSARSSLKSFSGAWSKLPNPIARRIGPWLASQLGA